MKKNNVMNIALIVLSVMMILGVLLSVYIVTTKDEHNVIRIQYEKGRKYAVEFTDLTLTPGEQCEYTIQLCDDAAEACELTLEFRDNAEDLTLKQFAYARIEADGEIVCDELLADIFNNEEYNVPVNFNDGTNTEIKVIFYLPAEVGNEAKNAKAEFELQITSSNE